MVVKFLSKYILEVVPSIVATVIGAYIVTHYINARPDADKAKTEAASPATANSSPAADKKPATADKSQADKSQAEKLAAEKSEKSDKPAETATAPSDARRPAKDAPKNKTGKAAPAHEAAPDDSRDANEIARAAIERLRGADGKETAKPSETPRVQEAARAQETMRTEPARAVQDRSRLNVVYAPAGQPPQVSPPQISPAAQPVAVQSAPALSAPPLPPAAAVTPSPSDNAPPVSAAIAPPHPSFAGNGRANDLLPRPTPPADIPSRPLDLRADPQDRTSVAEDVVSAAKSVFKAVVPQ